IVRETRLRSIGSARRERKRRWGRERDNEIYPAGLPVAGRGYAAHRSRVNLEFGEIALHRHRRILQIVLHLHINSAGPVGNKLRNGDRSQETDDRHHQEQLDQRETSDRFIDARRHAYPGWSCFYELSIPRIITKLSTQWPVFSRISEASARSSKRSRASLIRSATFSLSLSI